MAKNREVWIERPENGKLPKFAYSPYLVIQKNVYKKLLNLLSEFGMTPSCRTWVQVAPQRDSLDEFLAMYGS